MRKTRLALTRRQLAANRKNAIRSTGPRTAAGKAAVRLNALKHGAYARSRACGTMRAFDESPEHFQALLGALLESHRPMTAAQALLVEDLATLRWKRWRNQRAQESLLMQNLDRLELERLRRSLEIQNESCEVSQAEVLEKGLLRAPDSPAKFKLVLDLLEMLREQTERGTLSNDWDSFLCTLYGKEPSMRGVRIINVYDALMEKAREDDGEGYNSPPERSPESPPEAGPAEPSEEETLRQQMLRDLRLALLEEERDATEKYQLYLREQVEITPAMRGACLAPCHEEWRMLIRQENLIDRQIERKTKLLMQMQKPKVTDQGTEVRGQKSELRSQKKKSRRRRGQRPG